MARSSEFEFYGGLLNEILSYASAIYALVNNLPLFESGRLACRQKCQSWVGFPQFIDLPDFSGTTYSGLAW